MTTVGLFGILLSLLFWRVAFVPGTQPRFLIFAAALILHVVASILYYLYVQNNSADASLYYYDTNNYYRFGIGIGTQFVIFFVQLMKELFGGTFLDYFLLFQAFGFWGIIFLMRTIQEVYLTSGREQTTTSYLVLFLPGVHFWTSAIGKDGLIFLGCTLVTWAAMRLHTRLLAFGGGVAIMLLIRPHIALMALVALALATAFEKRVSALPKLFLFVGALAGAAYVAATVETTLQVDVRSASSVSDFLQRQSEITSEVGGGTSVAASYPVRLLSLLFRPLFFDAAGLYGFVASLENLVLIYLFVVALRNLGTVRSLVKEVFFIRFSFVFGSVVALMLALVYYNVGLGLRQKIMFMPALIALYSAVVAMRSAHGKHGVLKYA